MSVACSRCTVFVSTSLTSFAPLCGSQAKLGNVENMAENGGSRPLYVIFCRIASSNHEQGPKDLHLQFEHLVLLLRLSTGFFSPKYYMINQHNSLSGLNFTLLFRTRL